MYLRKKIEDSIKNAKLHNKSGELIDSKVIQKEFAIIKDYLLSNFTDRDLLGIYLDKDYRYLLTILACMAVGITYIPLNKSWPKERIKQIAEFSKCNIIDDDTIDFSKESVENSDTLFDNEILYIIFTSGSTGMPKGVKIKREGYVNYIDWVDSYFKDITSSDRALLTTDFTFDISLTEVALFLQKHIELYISNFNNNIFKMLYELEEYKITVHSTVPYNYSMVMSEGVYEKANLSYLKHIMLGGARFPYNLYYNFRDRLPNCNIYNFYGPTEATIYCSIHKMSYDEKVELHNSNVTIGKPFSGNKFIIVDDELLIGGKQVMKEYLNNPQKTQEALVELDGEIYYRSGDEVFVNSKGNYFIVGRKDDTVKVVGYRVNLSDIDAYIQKLNYINSVATIAVEKDEGESELVCYLILNENVDIKQIKGDLKEIMPSYQIPKYIKIVDNFPLNSSGKICKLTLKKRFLEK